MVNRAPVTIVIPTRNEAAQIAECVRGLGWADEVIVVDGRSTDGTRELARAAGARVLDGDAVQGPTIAHQRNAGIGAATHEWVFALDADERVGPELSAELAATVAAPACEAYAVRRRNVFLGETVRHVGWGRDWVVRLFRKNRRFVERKVHEALEPVPDVGRLASPRDHLPYRALTRYPHQLDGIVDRLPVGRRRTKSLPGLLLWSRRAATLARRHKVRFVHCGNVKPAGYPARWVLERCRVPYGIYFHGGDLLSEQHKIRHSRLKRRSARAILGGAAVLMVNSAWTRDLALGVLGELGLDGHGQRLRVVHLGTDPGRFMPGVDPTELRERLGLPEDGVRWMLTVARLTPHKGADTVLRALPAILEHAPDVRYAVAGSGPALDQLEELASAIGVADRVSFLGSVSDRDLPALYNLASVYVGASRLAERIGVEGFGISLVEASACGLPVVAGNSGGIPDAVRDGETGFLVPPEDPAALAAAIVRLLASPDLAKRVGAAGRRAVETYYNWDRVVRDLRAIEAEVVARSAV